jgi:chemosensory pili system protein ChpA (sensor histidine kinase/response regulator)
MFSGATISGEGKIRLILDISYIMETVVGQTVGSGRWTMDNGQGAEQDELLSTTHRSLPVDLDAQAPEILVADDSISIRKVVSHFLTNAGYHVEVANDGLEAWDKLNSSRRFDLLITDLEMPKMHGYELITQARNAGRTSGSPLEGLPIIVLTSRSGEKHYQKAVELGANDYLIKPFDEKKLLESIGKFFQPVRATH